LLNQFPSAAAPQMAFRLPRSVLASALLAFGGLEAACAWPVTAITPASLKIRVGHRSSWVNNENFSLRFFPPH
jgi:hypothetical protein